MIYGTSKSTSLSHRIQPNHINIHKPRAKRCQEVTIIIVVILLPLMYLIGVIVEGCEEVIGRAMSGEEGLICPGAVGNEVRDCCCRHGRSNKRLDGWIDLWGLKNWMPEHLTLELL